ncbi:MAG TPA: hypothetical protein VD866_20155 [Urbifossiella sp.]|nr:hypothetical protein [Urbifossiella sp.]
MTDSPATIETVAAASAALLVAEEMPAFRTATPAELFGLMQRYLAQTIHAYLDALNDWAQDD